MSTLAATGDWVVDANGDVIQLTNGVQIRPAGCRSSACAVTFAGTPVAMDQMVVTFTLRSNVRWSDGQALTAGDSVFGKVIACDPATSGSKYVCERTAAYEALG